MASIKKVCATCLAKGVKPKVEHSAEGVRSNFRSRWNEAMFLVIVGLLVEPAVHEGLHLAVAVVT